MKEAEGKVGAPIKVAGFVRYALGEGIEKQESDFAAEVAAAAGQELTEAPVRARGGEDGQSRQTSRSAYRRVIVKVSGEALAGPGGSGIHQPTIDRIAKDWSPRTRSASRSAWWSAAATFFAAFR